MGTAEKSKEMETTISKYFDYRSLIVLVLCLSGAGTSGYFLYRDFTASGGAGLGPPIAQVGRKESKVRRKPATSYVWAPVQTKESLYRKDSIQTASDSAATILLNNGASLDLSENSLVILDDSKELALNFLRGSAVLRDTAGDSKISIDNQGNAKIEKMPIKLLSPEPLSNFFTQQVAGKFSKTIAFRWLEEASKNSQTASSHYILEISKDPKFKTSTQSLKVARSKNPQATLALEAGKYFWRILDKDQALTESAQFRILTTAPIRPSWPIKSQKIVAWIKESPIQFRWMIPVHTEELDTYAEHVIEISKDTQFKNILLNQKVLATAGMAVIKGIPEGTLYWRIKSIYGHGGYGGNGNNGLTLSSSTEAFQVEKSQKLELELVKPEDNNAFPTDAPIRFSWHSGSNEVEYQLEIQSKTNPTKYKEVISTKTRALTHIWKEPLAGNYRWRVSAFWLEQAVSQTNWQEFSVFKGTPLVLKFPKPNQEIYYWDQPTPFSFEWEKDPLNQSKEYNYQIDIADDLEFKVNHLSHKTKEHTLLSIKLNLLAGIHFWRIRIVDGGNKTLKVSNPSKFTYAIHPPLRAPAHIAPAIGTVVDVLEEDKKIQTEWAKVEGAQGYEISLYQRSPAQDIPSKLLVQKTIEENHFEFTGLKEGDYYWTVKALDQLKRLGTPMDPKTFKITYGEPLAAPEITSPEVQ